MVARDDEAQDVDTVEMLLARGSNLIELVDLRWFKMLGGVGRPVLARPELIEGRFTLFLSLLKELLSTVVYLRE